MLQKIIKVGNSYAVTIPISFAKEVGLKDGIEVEVTPNSEASSLLVQKIEKNKKTRTPELKQWLENFNQKYKKGLAELSRK